MHSHRPSSAASSHGRVLVVEDDPAPRQELVDHLNLRRFEAQGVGSARALWAALADFQPHLVVLDISLADHSGLALAPLLRELHPDLGILTLTTLNSDEAWIAALDGGADAYLVKGVAREVVEATCRSILRRLRWFDDSAASTLPAPRPHVSASSARWVLDLRDCGLTGPNGRHTGVTLLELKFLEQLMRKPGEAMTRDKLLQGIGRAPTLNNLRNLDGCVSRLRRKIDDGIGLELPVRAFYGSGYVFTGTSHVKAHLTA